MPSIDGCNYRPRYLGPNYLDNNAATAIDPDTGCWMLDAGLRRNSIDWIKQPERSESIFLIRQNLLIEFLPIAHLVIVTIFAGLNRYISD